jgi:hypothetical protein
MTSNASRVDGPHRNGGPSSFRSWPLAYRRQPGSSGDGNSSTTRLSSWASHHPSITACGNGSGVTVMSTPAGWAAW